MAIGKSYISHKKNIFLIHKNWHIFFNQFEWSRHPDTKPFLVETRFHIGPVSKIIHPPEVPKPSHRPTCKPSVITSGLWSCTLRKWAREKHGVIPTLPKTNRKRPKIAFLKIGLWPGLFGTCPSCNQQFSVNVVFICCCLFFGRLPSECKNYPKKTFHSSANV